MSEHGLDQMHDELRTLRQRLAEVERECVRLRSYLTMQFTEPPYDYGDDISVPLAVELAEARRERDESERQIHEIQRAAFDWLGADLDPENPDRFAEAQCNEFVDLRRERDALKADLAHETELYGRLSAEYQELLGWLHDPLEAALRQARPSADIPPNVTVTWVTGSDNVADLLARAALARGKEGDKA